MSEWIVNLHLPTSNSMIKLPAPAVLAISVSPLGTPSSKLTVPYGIPVTVDDSDEALDEDRKSVV